MMMRMYSRLTSGIPRVCGVRRFRTIQTNEDRGDPYRTERLHVSWEQVGDR